MSPIRFILPLLLFFLSGEMHEVQGQPDPDNPTDQPLRIEIGVDSDKETYRIIPCSAQGMILFYQSLQQSSDKNSFHWYFTLYDTLLSSRWVRHVPIDASLDFTKAEQINDTLYILFTPHEKGKQGAVGFQILRIVLSSGNLILNNGRLSEAASLAGFAIRDGEALLAWNPSDSPPYLLILTLSDGSNHEFPVSAAKSASILTMTADPYSREILLLMTEKINKHSIQTLFLRVNPTGEILRSLPLASPEHTLLLQPREIYPTGPSQALITGSFLQDSRSRKADQQETTGFFTASVEQGILDAPVLINYLELKNIGELLSDRDLLTLRKKSLKNQRTNEPYSLDVLMLMHPLMASDSGYILAMETYYPQFHTESYTDYDFYGRPYTNSYNVFDGYRFTGFLVSGLSRSGNLLWDNAMDFRNLVRFSLYSNVVVYPCGHDELILAYLNEGTIRAKIINRDQTVESLSQSPLPLSDPNSKLLEETKSRLVHWYGSYFLGYGYQEIRNIAEPLSEKHRVFFATKLVFER